MMCSSWQLPLSETRCSEIAVVAIAVVEGEAGEAPREIAMGEPRMRLVHGDDIDVERAVRQHRAQEFRLDLDVTIGLRLGVAAGTHVVQHENGADACEDWSQQLVRAGEVKRFQSGTDEGVAECFHQGVAAGWNTCRN
jgi:hypothetical protein